MFSLDQIHLVHRLNSMKITKCYLLLAEKTELCVGECVFCIVCVRAVGHGRVRMCVCAHHACGRLGYAHMASPGLD